MQLTTYHINHCGVLEPLPFDSQDHEDPDPRGLIKLWEPPKPNAKYVVGVDATLGITNWDRSLRSEDDMKTDNGVVEVLRIGGFGQPDVQVGEYAAPIDAEDLADVACFLGRLYCGNSEYGEALMIIEVWPGPGLLTQRRLINTFGYTNIFRWEYLDAAAPKATNSYGWTSNSKSLQLLWSRGSRHLSRDQVRIYSPWLVEELADLQKIEGKTFPQPSGEYAHDDRVRALFMAIWAGHDWSMGEGIPEPQPVSRGSKEASWQSSDMSAESMYDAWEDKFQSLLHD